ncbi:putative mannosyltransferase ktr4 [Exophiala oligosperma]
MSDNYKVYGFTLKVYDDPMTLPSLWPQTLDFIAANPQHLSHPRAIYGVNSKLATSNSGDSAYESFFQALDRTSGFSMNDGETHRSTASRWGFSRMSREFTGLKTPSGGSPARMMLLADAAY